MININIKPVPKIIFIVNSASFLVDKKSFYLSLIPIFDNPPTLIPKNAK